ncbi:hypothetical protein [Bradyrhizobium uaiense]|uniref:Uncharacterized protein n=1 Tax=Bradyrhizobium uaiense TaxID=2594946 RepID=A0A6P1BBA3_9BRAD|nr:hypothetical protein [Bradyrhizobium uaiense]NEU95756.1 hypothetical protein [Bradyrhizobium uaiense]
MDKLADATGRRVLFKSFAYKDARTASSQPSDLQWTSATGYRFVVSKRPTLDQIDLVDFARGRAALANLTYEVVTSE